MKTTHSKVIDGIEFTIDQLPAMRALRLLNKLARLASPALGAIGAAFSQSKSVANMDLDALGRGASALLSSLSDDEMEAITRELLGSAIMRSGGKNVELLAVFDLEFRGKMGTVLKLLGFALEVNYGNFIEALKGAAGTAGSPTE